MQLRMVITTTITITITITIITNLLGTMLSLSSLMTRANMTRARNCEV